MTVVLFVFSVLAFLLGGDIFISSKNAVDQITALILLLISALFFVGAAIVDAIGKLRKWSAGCEFASDRSRID